MPGNMIQEVSVDVAILIPVSLPLSDSMTEYPSPESVSHEQFQQILDKLKLLLENLPTALPSLGTSSAYLLFNDYQPDPDLMEKTGCEVSTLRR